MIVNDCCHCLSFISSHFTAQKVKQRKTEWAIGFRVYPCAPGATQVCLKEIL